MIESCILRFKIWGYCSLNFKHGQLKPESIWNLEFQMMLGLLVGSFVGGRLGDAYGRKPVMFGALAILVPSVVAGGIYPNYIAYAILRFVSGTSKVSINQILIQFNYSWTNFSTLVNFILNFDSPKFKQNVIFMIV